MKKSRSTLAMRSLLLSGAMLSLATQSASAAAESTATAKDSTEAEGGAQASSAAPQAADASVGNDPLGEILVTARRVTESASRVPIAISAVSADQLGKQMIYDSRSLMLQVPGLQQATRIPGNPVPTALTRIRGVTGIANYFNEVPYGAAAWSFYAPFFDVQGVEVLKGPQGTLFGQASNAGAIVIRPNRPGNELAGYARLSVGTYNQRSIEGAIDIPLVADKVFLRVAAKTEARDGWARDIYTGTKNGKMDYDVERATLVIKPSSAFENETMFQMEHVRDLGQTVWIPNDYDFLAENSTPAQRAALAAQARRNGYVNSDGTANIAAWNLVRAQILARQEQIGPNRLQGWSQGCPATEFTSGTPSTVPGPNTNLDTVVSQPCGYGIGGYAKNYAIVNKTTWNLTDDLTLKNIFSRTWGGNNVAAQDLDGTRLIMQDSDNAGAGLRQNYPTTVSDELQLSGNLFDGALDFVTGAFYFESKQGLQPNGTYALNRLPGAASVITNNVQRTRTWAGYAQGNYRFNDKLTFTGGLRYTNDYAYLANYIFRAATQTYELQPVLAGGQPGANTASWSALSYTASLQYQLAPRSMLYLTNSKGFSSGGLQNVRGLEKFDPDSLNNIELGLKSTVRLDSDWQVRTDVAGFYGFYNNVKVTTGFYTAIPNTNPPATQIVIATTNGATARNWGVDADLSVAFRDLFTLRGFVTHAKSKYIEFAGPVQQAPQLGIVDLKDSPFPNSPPWKFGITGSVNIPTDSETFGDLSLTAQYTYTSEYWVTYGKPQTPYVPGDPDTAAVCKARRTIANGYPASIADGKMAYKDCAPALDNVNLTVTWDNPLGSKGLTAQVTVTNLLNNKTIMGVTSGYDTALYNSAYPNLPRFVYVSLKKSF